MWIGPNEDLALYPIRLYFRQQFHSQDEALYQYKLSAFYTVMIPNCDMKSQT